MPLQAIDGQGNIAHHCDNPECEKHISTGNMHVHHILHPEIQYTGEKVVALPMCACGTQKFLNVNFTEEDTKPHTETQLENTLVEVKIEDLPPGEHQLLARDGKYYLMVQQSVTKIVPAREAIRHHIALHNMLQASGKTYTATQSVTGHALNTADMVPNVTYAETPTGFEASAQGESEV